MRPIARDSTGSVTYAVAAKLATGLLALHQYNRLFRGNKTNIAGIYIFVKCSL